MKNIIIIHYESRKDARVIEDILAGTAYAKFCFGSTMGVILFDNANDAMLFALRTPYTIERSVTGEYENIDVEMIYSAMMLLCT